MRISQFPNAFRATVRPHMLIYWLFITSLSIVIVKVVDDGISDGLGPITQLRPRSCFRAIFSCLVLALSFVGSLYVWRYSHHRDHPSTIRKRCASVFCAIAWSPVFVYYSLHGLSSISHPSLSQEDPIRPFWQILGFRLDGFIFALFVPLGLTVILFTGPLLMRAHDGVFWYYLDRHYWLSNFHNLVWLRNHLVAPFSEEFSFRACMLPLLAQCFGKWTSTFICPLFFGVAHVHHLVDKLRVGCDVERALLETLFQFAFTTVFGVYSAFLFLRTGHFVAPFVVHAFCNHMGFPDFGEVSEYAQPKKSLIMIAFIVGLVSWIFLLMPLTEPRLYGNDIYWPTN